MTRPWWETWPRGLWTELDRRAALKAGWKPPASEDRARIIEEQEMRAREMVRAPPELTFPAVAPPERQEAERRRRRVDRLLAKHGIGGPLPAVEAAMSAADEARAARVDRILRRLGIPVRSKPATCKPADDAELERQVNPGRVKRDLGGVLRVR